MYWYYVAENSKVPVFIVVYKGSKVFRDSIYYNNTTLGIQYNGKVPTLLLLKIYIHRV